MKDDVSVKKLNELSEHRIRLEFYKDELKLKLKQTNAAIGETDDSINKILNSESLQKFSHPRGTLSIEIKESVKLPATPEKWEEFFDWLKSEGIYDEYRTVNSASLNSLFRSYKADLLAKAQASGDREELAAAINFLPPGLEQPAPYERIRLTGKKQVGDD